jgi:succinate dehydrogenase/fumarate reductase flavoprotein subunit
MGIACDVLVAGSGAGGLAAAVTALRAYGVGFVKPRPLPLAPHLDSGYLLERETVRALAEKAGIEHALEQAVARYDEHAKSGSDPDFSKGANAYNRFYGDADIKPNPCVAPLARPPFHSVRVEIGDLGTDVGIAMTFGWIAGRHLAGVS